MKKIKIIFLILIGTLPLLSSVQMIGAQEATEEADTIREKVQEKIEEAKNKPKAYIGTITDVTENTFQIKNKDAEIQLIAVDEDETTFVLIGKTSEEIKFSDIAIGDFIVAMGYKNGNDILEAKRVLSQAPIEEPDQVVIYGEIQNIEKKEITIGAKDKGEVLLTFPKSWKGPEIAELRAGMNVIVVYTSEKDSLTIRTIEIADKTDVSPTSEENEE